MISGSGSRGRFRPGEGGGGGSLLASLFELGCRRFPGPATAGAAHAITSSPPARGRRKRPKKTVPAFPLNASVRARATEIDRGGRTGVGEQRQGPSTVRIRGGAPPREEEIPPPRPPPG